VSEKPMTELLRKSGIIDKHIVEFEKWRLIDPKDECDKSANLMVEDLLDDIVTALEREPIMKQTVVTPIRVTPPQLWYAPTEVFHANMDEMGRLVVGTEIDLSPGEIIWCEGKADEEYIVTQQDDLYENDKIVARLITVEKEEE
jgi:hypothetical protein